MGVCARTYTPIFTENQIQNPDRFSPGEGPGDLESSQDTYTEIS